METWNPTYTVHLGPDCSPEIPLVDIGGGFRIYAFDLTGEARWNNVAAASLEQKLQTYQFDALVTVQTKSCCLAQALTARLGMPKYLEIRKSRKPFMTEPMGVTVKSITTNHQQELWVGKEKYAPFIGKKLCFLDDVVSTGGTIDAMLELAEKIGLNITVVACILTEHTRWTSYRGIPVVSLDHIPLPATTPHP